MAMERQRLQSSVLVSASYDDEDAGGTLMVTFRNGRTYSMVAPRAVYDGLINAQSPGQYFNENVRGKY